jgi:DNA-binding response OmpR family regulator
MELIFIVEDNDNLREALVSYLKLAEYEVREYSGIKGVPHAVHTLHPHCIILDVMLPDGDGFKLAKELRAKSDVPIIFLTAKTSESDKIIGFEIGADDYIIKPFSPKELILRIKAVLRRRVLPVKKIKVLHIYQYKESQLSIDTEKHIASVNGRQIQLTASEWKIMICLAERTGIVVSREILLQECLDYSAAVSERTVDTHVKNLRAKLGHASWIETVRSFGYRFGGTAL